MIHSMYFEFYEAFLSEVLWLTICYFESFLFFLYSEFFSKIYILDCFLHVTMSLCRVYNLSLQVSKCEFNSTTRFLLDILWVIFLNSM